MQTVRRIEQLVEDELLSKMRDAFLRYAAEVNVPAGEIGATALAAIAEEILAQMSNDNRVLVCRFVDSLLPTAMVLGGQPVARHTPVHDTHPLAIGMNICDVGLSGSGLYLLCHRSGSERKKIVSASGGRHPQFACRNGSLTIGGASPGASQGLGKEKM